MLGLATQSKKRVPLPTDLPGLVMWLDSEHGLYDAVSGGSPISAATHATGTPILRWEDRSGNGHHVTQATSTKQFVLNAEDKSVMDAGYGATLKNFEADLMTIDKRSFSIYVIFEAMKAGSGIGLTLFAAYAADATTFTLGFSTNNAKLAIWDNGTRASNSIFGGMQLMGATSKAGELRMLMDAEVYVNTQMTVNVANLTTVGGAKTGSSSMLKIKDFIVYNEPHSLEAVKSVIYKYAKSKGANSDIPIKPLNYHAQGDSITFGSSSTNWKSYAQYVKKALRSDKTFSNMGTSNAKLVDLNNDDIMLVNGSNNVMSLFIGTNDINGGINGTTLEGNLNTFCTARRAAGWKVIVISCMYRAEFLLGGGLKETERLAYNAAMRANWQNYADGFVDLGADTNVGTTQAAGYFNADNIHPSDLGHEYIGKFIANEVSRIACS